MIAAKRGRPAKAKLSEDDMFEEVFFKMYEPKWDPVKGLVFSPTRNPLTLEEAQLMVARENYEVSDSRGRRVLEPKKFSTMGIQKIETRALEKARNDFRRRDGAKCSADVLDWKGGQVGTGSQNRLCSEVY